MDKIKRQTIRYKRQAALLRQNRLDLIADEKEGRLNAAANKEDLKTLQDREVSKAQKQNTPQ